MVKIEIPFKQAPTSIQSHDGNVTTVAAAPRVDQVSQDRTEAMQALDAMASQLQRLDRIMKTKVEMIGSQVRTIAMELARQALTDDDELVQARVQQFAETLLAESLADGSEQNAPAKLFAHPNCVVTLQQWCEQSGRNDVNVLSDPALAPGDARVELGSAGLLAALTELLTAAASAYTPSGAPLQR